MSAQAQPHLTPEQYLAAERTAEFKHEYYDGRIYAMSGGSCRAARTAMVKLSVTSPVNCEQRLGRALVQLSPKIYAYGFRPTVSIPIPTSLSSVASLGLLTISTTPC